MSSSKTTTLILASMAFLTVIGGATYEHIAAVPRWSAAPPLSLSMVQGKYGLNPAPFWQAVHPVTLLLLISSLVLNWKNERKKLIGTALTLYIVILVVTALYFVPELLSILSTPFADHVDENLQNRSSTWEILSLFRLLLMAVLAYILLLALSKSSFKTVEK